MKPYGSVSLAAHEIENVFGLGGAGGVAGLETAIFICGRSGRGQNETRRIGTGRRNYEHFDGFAAVARNLNDQNCSRILSEDEQRFVLSLGFGVEIVERVCGKNSGGGDADGLTVAYGNGLASGVDRK